MALRHVTVTPLTRRQIQAREQTRAHPTVQPLPPEGGPELKLRKRPLFALCLGLPLVLALGGFVGAGVRLPAWPEVLVEPTQRGAILAGDGTILAEGDAGLRRYPQGRLAAHLIGFSGSEQPDGSYGLEGLELKLDATLQAGEDVQLTLDPDLQAIAQTELARAAALHGAKNGAVVMLEAGTGRVLASAAYPDFDPNAQATFLDRSVIGNRPFTALVEPGSVMKPFVVAALLHDRRLQPDEVLDVDPSLRVGDKTFTDVTAHEPRLEIRDILRVSSNVGMIRLGERFSSTELAAWYHRFGFGREVAINYAANEQGIINPPEDWVPQDHASAVIGQSMSATALQLAAAYSIFANDGLYIAPQIVASRVASTSSERVLEPGVARTVREMLAYTVQNSSLIDAKIPGVSVAGKSGSADLYDVDKGAYIDAGTLSFAGIFPAEKPKVIGVMYLQRVTEKGALSVSVTAPAFRAIGSQAVALWDEAALTGR